VAYVPNKARVYAYAANIMATTARKYIVPMIVRDVVNAMPAPVYAPALRARGASTARKIGVCQRLVMDMVCVKQTWMARILPVTVHHRMQDLLVH